MYNWPPLSLSALNYIPSMMTAELLLPGLEAPKKVGILGMEIYFPAQHVEQQEMEAFDGVSSGKYTVGLGQDRMAVCMEDEDVYSMSLTGTYIHACNI